MVTLRVSPVTPLWISEYKSFISVIKSAVVLRRVAPGGVWSVLPLSQCETNLECLSGKTVGLLPTAVAVSMDAVCSITLFLKGAWTLRVLFGHTAWVSSDGAEHAGMFNGLGKGRTLRIIRLRWLFGASLTPQALVRLPAVKSDEPVASLRNAIVCGPSLSALTRRGVVFGNKTLSVNAWFSSDKPRTAFIRGFPCQEYFTRNRLG